MVEHKEYSIVPGLKQLSVGALVLFLFLSLACKLPQQVVTQTPNGSLTITAPTGPGDDTALPPSAAPETGAPYPGGGEDITATQPADLYPAPGQGGTIDTPTTGPYPVPSDQIATATNPAPTTQAAATTGTVSSISAATPSPTSTVSPSPTTNGGYPPPGGEETGTPEGDGYPGPGAEPPDQTPDLGTPTQSPTSGSTGSPTASLTLAQTTLGVTSTASAATLTPASTLSPIPEPSPTQTLTPAPTLTPTPTLVPLPAWMVSRLQASDPSQVILASGRVQFVMFFAFWDGACQAMAPLIHGLEGQYHEQVNFIYLDIDDPATQPLRQALGYRYQPYFVLLAEDGRVIKQWQGYVNIETLRLAIEDAIE
ncbi:MAG: hypothetical protein JXB15_05600 [Anaerolineales bacterium]|nr:hypothetical protein [Anaerolineales bacterium]